jgi:hypothetical protein
MIKLDELMKERMFMQNEEEDEEVKLDDNK